MKHLKYLLIAIGLLIASQADAATCFWVGGTGLWSTANGVNWSSSTGGAGSTCAATGGVPKQAADTATFDGASGGGVVTVDSTMNGTSLTQIVSGAFTGTLTFATNNPSMTMVQWAGSGTGTRTISMGSGTFTFTGGNSTWDFSNVTGLTFNPNTSTIIFSGNQSNRTFIMGGKSFNIVTVSSSATNGADFTFSSAGTPTIATLNLTSPVAIVLPVSMNITNAFNWTGSSATSPIIIQAPPASGANSTITTASGTATCAWCVFIGVTGAGGATFNATNSFGYNNSGITVTGPSGGGHIIGG